MMLEVNGLVEVDHIVDERRQRGRERTGPASNALLLLSPRGPLDAAPLGAQPPLHPLEVARCGTETPSELLRADPVTILGRGRILLRSEECTQGGLVSPAEPDVGASGECSLREIQ